MKVSGVNRGSITTIIETRCFIDSNQSYKEKREKHNNHLSNLSYLSKCKKMMD